MNREFIPLLSYTLNSLTMTKNKVKHLSYTPNLKNVYISLECDSRSVRKLFDMGKPKYYILFYKIEFQISKIN